MAATAMLAVLSAAGADSSVARATTVMPAYDPRVIWSGRTTVVPNEVSGLARVLRRHLSRACMHACTAAVATRPHSVRALVAPRQHLVGTSPIATLIFTIVTSM